MSQLISSPSGLELGADDYVTKPSEVTLDRSPGVRACHFSGTPRRDRTSQLARRVIERSGPRPGDVILWLRRSIAGGNSCTQ